MKKVFALTVALLMMATLAACGSTPSSTPAASGGSEPASSTPASAPASGDDVTINFYGHSDNQPLLEKTVEAFNAQSDGITVALQIIENDAYDDKVKVLAAAGSSEVMDVFWIRGPAQTRQYMAQNALADLSGFAAESGLDLAPIQDTTLKAVTQEDGSFYALPTTGSAWLLFYNKDLFDAKGLEAPDSLTWDEYAELAAELTYEEDGTKYWGGGIPPWTMNLGASSAGEYLTADPMPYTRQYAEVLHRLYATDKSHPGIAEMKSGTFDIRAFFESGTVYMMINGDWSYNLLETDFTYGTASLPVFDDVESGSTVGSCGYYVVSAQSKYQKEGYTFVEWATTSDEGTSLMAEAKSVPCYPTDAAMEVYNRQLDGVIGVEYRFSAKVGDEQGYDDYYSTLNDTFKEELELYLLDEQSLDECFDNYYTLREEIIAG